MTLPLGEVMRKKDQVSHSIFTPASARDGLAGITTAIENTTARSHAGHTLRTDYPCWCICFTPPVYEKGCLAQPIPVGGRNPGFPRWLLPIADNGSTMGIRLRIRPSICSIGLVRS